jgi:hypothetical protein
VAVFLKENQNLEDLTEEELKKFDTCIFHCGKENEIWMENVEEYRQWKERRDKALKEGENSDEEIKIKWNKDLVNEFWRRVRAYRFAVDYADSWLQFGNDNDRGFFIGNFIRDMYNELKEDEDLVFFNLKNLKTYNYYDFRGFIFPKFYVHTKPFRIFNKTDNFWYKKESLTFKKEVYFRKITFQKEDDLRRTTFLDKVDFGGVIFKEKAYFSGTTFQNVADFSDTIFQNVADFSDAIFQNMADFRRSKFQNKANFSRSTFQNVAFFIGSTFQDKADFSRSKFQNEANFNGSTFQARIGFQLVGRSLLFDFSNIQLSKDSYIEIRNLQTVRLVLNDINNITDNFLFFDTKIIKFEDLEKNQRKNLKKEDYLPNIEIENSILNNMKFINCDFSEAEQIKIENSSLTETEFMNVDWGEISEKRICPELFENSPAKARDVYRQLKLALDNQKDHINANEFYSLEMKAYERVLQEKPWKTHFQEKLVFSIHKSVSNFGQSWTKPLTLIIMLTIGMMGLKTYPIFFVPLFLIYLIFFLLTSTLNPAIEFGLQEVIFLLASAGFFSYVLGNFDFSRNLSSKLLIKSVINFLNDFAKTLNLMKSFKENGKGFEFPYTLYSIVVAFLTYQMIVAIRRQVRR